MAGAADTPQRPGHVPSRANPRAADALRAARHATQEGGMRPGILPPPSAFAEAEDGPPGMPPQTPSGVTSGAPGPAPIPMQVPRANDPLARPYALPSGGLFYHAHNRHSEMLISPTRGMQEQLLAGASDNWQAKLPALRMITEQCMNTGPIPFDELLFNDWLSALFHFMAYSAGSDIIGIRPQHTQRCGPTKVVLHLTELPCTVLRLAEPGEDVTWPVTPVDEEADDLEAVMRELDEEEESERGLRELVVSERDAQEPFVTPPLPHTGDMVTWRFLRVKDIEIAEKFASRMGTDIEKGSPLHSFLHALHIVEINGRKVSKLEAVRWFQSAASPTLNGLRDQFAARDFGYDITPRVRCHCGSSFRVRLPLDGGIFRRRPPASERPAGADAD